MYFEMAKRGVELDKADFAVTKYEVDEEKYPRQGPKEPSTSGKKKMKMDDTMTIELSEESSDDDDDDEELVQPSQENTDVQLVSLEASNEEMDEEHLEGQSVPLMGLRLGSVN